MLFSWWSILRVHTNCSGPSCKNTFRDHSSSLSKLKVCLSCSSTPSVPISDCRCWVAIFSHLAGLKHHLIHTHTRVRTVHCDQRILNYWCIHNKQVPLGHFIAAYKLQMYLIICQSYLTSTLGSIRKSHFELRFRESSLNGSLDSQETRPIMIFYFQCHNQLLVSYFWSGQNVLPLMLVFIILPCWRHV